MTHPHRAASCGFNRARPYWFSNADMIQAETGRFLFVRKSFWVNLQMGDVTALASKSEN